MGIERYTPVPAWGLSHAVSTSGAGRYIHVAGHVGLGPSNDSWVETIGMEEEARATFEYIKRTLAAIGADLSHVVKINAFLTNLDDYDAYARVRAEYFGDALPASASVGVASLLLGAHVEVDALAFVPDP